MKPASVREELKFKLNNTRRPILAGTRLSINFTFVDIRYAILFLLLLLNLLYDTQRCRSVPVII